MTLAEAFRIFLDPALPDGPVREQAARMLLDEARKLARRKRHLSPADLDDAMQTLMLRLLQAGPLRADGPDTDDRVRGFLAQSLENNALPSKAAKKTVALDDPKLEDKRPVDGGDARRLVFPVPGGPTAWAATTIARAEQVLWEELLPEIAGEDADEARALLRSIQAVAEGHAPERSVVELAAARAGEVLEAPAARRRVQNRIAKTAERLRARLRDAIARRRVGGGLAPELAQALEIVVGGLRQRGADSGSPRRGRGPGSEPGPGPGSGSDPGSDPGSGSGSAPSGT